MRKSLKEKVLSDNGNFLDEKLLEKIAEDTAKEIKTLPKKSRPKKIYLFGANPTSLVKIMVALYNKLDYKVEILTEKPFSPGVYSVNVGYYLKISNSKVS